MMSKEPMSFPWARVWKRLVVGLLFGAAFGVFFGGVASLFHNGPGFLEGVLESAPWFAAFGAFAGFVLGLEKSELPVRS